MGELKGYGDERDGAFHGRKVGKMLVERDSAPNVAASPGWWSQQKSSALPIGCAESFFV